jgi:UDP-glucuronate decarboxylase
MKILVTGGAGFIGTNLVHRLLTDGHRVHVWDNLSTGSIENVKLFSNHRKFSWQPLDVTDPIPVDAVPRGTRQIYNLASPASPKAYSAKPLDTLLASTVGMKAVLDVAKACDAKVLQASTSEVYGDPLEHPQRESYWGNVNPRGPRACYDEGKRVAETLCKLYQDEGQEVRIARLFNTYGPLMQPDDGRVVSNFIVQAIRGEPLTIYGSGLQTRSLCYVSDTVNALIKLMATVDENRPVNIGNPREINILDLAATIKRLARSHSEIEFRDLPQDDPIRRQPNITHAVMALDWQPIVSLTEGLTNTIRYFSDLILPLSKAAE